MPSLLEHSPMRATAQLRAGSVSDRRTDTVPLTPIPSPSGRGEKVDSVLMCVRVAAFVLLAASFLVAHGCHADEDTELLAPIVEWMKVSPSPPTPLPQGEGS